MGAAEPAEHREQELSWRFGGSTARGGDLLDRDVVDVRAELGLACVDSLSSRCVHPGPVIAAPRGSTRSAEVMVVHVPTLSHAGLPLRQPEGCCAGGTL